MGVKIFDLLPKKEINIKNLNQKVIAIDSYLYLYQFLSTIRLPDGSLLTNSEGKVTSHLNGLFFRTTKLMSYGIRPAFIFDGIAPKLKQQERERRAKLKEKATLEYKEAYKREDIENMKKYASRTSKLTSEMVEDAKELISSMGLPIIQAPSEGEAQAAQLVKNEHAYALATNDGDALLFGTPKLIKNLTTSQKKKVASTRAFTSIKPELFNLSDVLNNLKVDQEQLIALGLLIGTDFNIGGIKGIGPAKGLKLIHEHQNDFDGLFKAVKWEDYFDYPWTEAFYTIKKMPVTDDYSLKFGEFNLDKTKELLTEKYGFSENRVDPILSKFKASSSQKEQKGLSQFF